MIWLIPYFQCTHIHNSSLTYIIWMINFIIFLPHFYFEVTFVVVETIVVVIEVSQVVPFKPIQSFLIIYVNNTMNSHRINYYCYRHNYFTVCTLQVISLIVSSIQSIVSRNSEVRVVICLEWPQFSYDLTHYIFSMQSHSYFITHIYYFHFRFYHIPNKILLQRDKHRKTGCNKVLFTAVREADLLS